MKIPVLFSFILVSVPGNAFLGRGSSSKSKTDEDARSVPASNDKDEGAKSEPAVNIVNSYAAGKAVYHPGEVSVLVKNKVVDAVVSADSGDTAIDISEINVARPETSTVYGLEFGPNELTVKTFYSGNKIYATRVLDNGVLIWEVSGKERCKFVELYYKGDSKLLRLLIVLGGYPRTYYLYYEKVDGRWKNVPSQNEFYKKLEELKNTFEQTSRDSESPKNAESFKEGWIKSKWNSIRYSRSSTMMSSPVPQQSLDLDDVTDPRCKVIYVDIDGVPVRMHIMSMDTNVTKLIYGENEVWTIPAEDEYMYCIEYLQNGESKIVTIITDKKNELHQTYRKYQDTNSWYDGFGWFGTKGWKNYDRKYLEKINALKVGPNLPTRFALDISSSEDTYDCIVTRSEQDCITTLFFATNSGNILEKVVDGGRHIFTVPDDRICYLCEVHSSGNYKLLRLHIKSGNYQLSFQNFDYYDGDWDVLTNAEFNQILKTLW
ncbi:hypothetical protein BEWA_026540 [Theileria equi strain WA]|uniref:Signal peptide containing protein n=1 Tax=Theileria equi strain WA TaxID=1537102 RepID=L0AW82_THEEQ|nr:hypothetical protein BEWA_026540 [Theileria equi strain WA]AFZ79805.1 hypothetical protein BEWA_026540 [Theileria equi strain WA]|eukprot:XP_004829471.1 hypothetical protein BEWA_026540 [Theileria equi strain WA]